MPARLSASGINGSALHSQKYYSNILLLIFPDVNVLAVNRGENISGAANKKYLSAGIITLRAGIFHIVNTYNSDLSLTVLQFISSSSNAALLSMTSFPHRNYIYLCLFSDKVINPNLKVHPSLRFSLNLKQQIFQKNQRNSFEDIYT